MRKNLSALCLSVLLLILCVVPASASGLPFVKPNQDIVVPLAYEALQFWERELDDPYLVAPPPLEQGVPILTVVAADVGAKDCIILQCDGEAILLDCGDTGAHNIVERVIRQMGIERFDAAINTHPHDDHLSAYPFVLSLFPADTMYVCFPEDTDCYSKYLSREMAALGIPVVQLDIDQPMRLGAATLYFRRFTKSTDINPRSLIVQAVLGERTILLTADANSSAFDNLVQSLGPDAFQGDILKAPHHGCEELAGGLIRSAQMQAIFATGYPWGDAGKDFRGQLVRIQFEAVYTVLGSVVMKTDGSKWIIAQLPREIP
ncbi:MAG: MBL fold metallo-hydrolase [Clostridiales bacterium]|nr:MBL fold metallo-hydrolase [Clostridiales bacterium]